MKTFMKTSLLFLMLCCALQLTSADTMSNDMANSICCFNETSKIPLNRLESYFWTSRICPLKYTVFVTIMKKQFCGNPENAWVKRAMKHIDKKSASNSAK
ncbi:C-C motif chemokine 2 [Sinocyclocheilus grahami]|uniref:C-C motif chemokine 2 n=1 Tax=Sinocyclocheilus grahami TaxID=75366 RepID=UPI0007ACB02C|nr:PREDICTED: C-C motif chemokine 2-like [Sinocyclocheilus grahami]